MTGCDTISGLQRTWSGSQYVQRSEKVIIIFLLIANVPMDKELAAAALRVRHTV